MRSTGAALSLAVVLAAGVSGCDAWSGAGDSEVGTGFLTVADLAAPPQPGHFTAAPVPVRATLAVTSAGCVTVTADGVTRMPFWPDGTQVEDDTGQPGRYTVRIPSGPLLTATSTGGSTFRATGVVDGGQPFDADSKIGGHLGFCAVRAAPIAFRDGSSFR